MNARQSHASQPPKRPRANDPDATDPVFHFDAQPEPTFEVVFPQPSGDGSDPTRDALASRFPAGVLVVDFRSYAPAVLLRARAH
jgi:hypothetical protein